MWLFWSVVCDIRSVVCFIQLVVDVTFSISCVWYSISCVWYSISCRCDFFDQLICLSQHQNVGVKAETHDATNRCNKSPRQVAATNRLVWHMKIIVAAKECCRCILSHEFKLVWIRATYPSDQVSARPCCSCSADETTCRRDLSHRVSRP